MKKYTEVIARILLAQIFVVAVVVTISQISSHPDGYNAYTAYFAAHGLPGIFAPLTIFIQLVFGVGLLLGYKTKVCAYVLMVYAIFFALFIKMQEVNGLIFVLQYLAIAGGLLMVAIHNKMALSLDRLSRP
jgi:putative oxidoreductase